MLNHSKRWQRTAVLAGVIGLFVVIFVPFGSTQSGLNLSSPTISTLTTTGHNAVTYTGYINGESFQQEAIRTHNGWQYVVWWDSESHANISRRQLPNGAWQNIDFTDYVTSSTDSHNVISFGISHADGTIHLAYDMHNSGMQYRVSQPGVATNPHNYTWSASLFSSSSSTLNGLELPSNLTYPAFMSSLNGKLQMTIRQGGSGGGDQLLYEYDGAGSHGMWTSLGVIIEGGTANAYMFGQEYGPDRCLHMTWTWRKTSNPSTNHDLMYAYSCDEGRTWRNNTGTEVAVTATDPLTASSSGVKVWAIDENRGLMNQESQVISSDGTVHIAASHMPDSEASDSDFMSTRKKARIVHYRRNPVTKAWSQTVTSFQAQLQRADIAADRNNNVYLVFTHTGDKKLRVATASASSGWSDWRLRYTSSINYFSDPLVDQWRMKSEDALSVFAPRDASNTIDVLTWTMTQ